MDADLDMQLWLNVLKEPEAHDPLVLNKALLNFIQVQSVLVRTGASH